MKLWDSLKQPLLSYFATLFFRKRFGTFSLFCLIIWISSCKVPQEFELKKTTFLSTSRQYKFCRCYVKLNVVALWRGPKKRTNNKKIDIKEPISSYSVFFSKWDTVMPFINKMVIHIDLLCRYLIYIPGIMNKYLVTFPGEISLPERWSEVSFVCLYLRGI